MLMNGGVEHGMAHNNLDIGIASLNELSIGLGTLWLPALRLSTTSVYIHTSTEKPYRTDRC